MDFRIGQGYDVHQLVEGRPLIIGGVNIPYERGLLGHSDADVLLHAITDALLGAVAAPDIGSLFSPTDPRWKDNLFFYEYFNGDTGEVVSVKIRNPWAEPSRS